MGGFFSQIYDIESILIPFFHVFYSKIKPLGISFSVNIILKDKIVLVGADTVGGKQVTTFKSGIEN